MPQPIRKLTVLISGSGTNLAAIINACHSTQLPNTSIVRVISNRKDAYGLVRAEDAQIPTRYHNLVAYKKKFPDSTTEARSAYDEALADLVKADHPDLVVCAGWMHVFSPSFLEPMAAARIPVINLHPALPNAYDGVDAIRRAHDDWKAGKIDQTGLMIHDVIEKVDAGQPLLVKTIPFVKGQDDELEAFEQRLHELEWAGIVQGISIALKHDSMSAADSKV